MLYANIAAFFANLVLNWRWIPLIGMRGAAWSTLWTEVLLTLGCLVALRQTDASAATSPDGMPGAALEAES